MRERVVIKRNNADILWDSYVFPAKSVNTPHGNIVVGADNGVRQDFMIQELHRHKEAVCAGGFSQPDILIFQLQAGIFEFLLYTLQSMQRPKVVILSADKCNFLVSP